VIFNVETEINVNQKKLYDEIYFAKANQQINKND
jgi:hypothetical protein